VRASEHAPQKERKERKEEASTSGGANSRLDVFYSQQSTFACAHCSRPSACRSLVIGVASARPLLFPATIRSPRRSTAVRSGPVQSSPVRSGPVEALPSCTSLLESTHVLAIYRTCTAAYAAGYPHARCSGWPAEISPHSGIRSAEIVAGGRRLVSACSAVP